jgi:type IV pilus assembly protein PilM
MSDSIWKKEISFSRKKPQPDAAPEASAAPVEPAPAEPKQSFWKKEISFSHKDAAHQESAPPAEAAPAEPKQSIWKKDLSLGHKANEAAPPPAAAPASVPQPKESLLRKEISFGRKAKEAAPAPVEASVSPEPKQSMWKKEITFSRKKHDKELERIAEDAAQAVAPSFAPPFAPPADVPPTAVAEAVVAAMPPADVDEPSPPFTPAEPFPLAAAPAVEPAPAAVEPPPAVEPAPFAVEPLPPADEPLLPPDEPLPFVPPPLQIAPEPPESALEPVEAAPVVESVPAEPEPVEPLAAEPPAAEPVAAEPVAPLVPFAPVSFEPPPSVPLVPVEPEPVASSPVVPVPELPLDAAAEVEPEPPLAPAPPPLSTLSAAVGAASTEAPEEPPAAQADVVAFPEAPPAAPPELVQPESVAFAPVPPPIQLAPEPVELPPLAAPEQPVDPWLAGAELPPAPAAPPPTTVFPPVPAAELAPIVEPKVPFWKKELSFSRKPKPAAVEPQPAVAAPAEAPAASGPWWKKELSFSRKPKPAVAAAPVAAAVAVASPPAAKTPWWKKEIGGKKKTAVPAVAPGAAAPAPVAAPPSEPFWKRGLSMSAPKLPKGSSKGGGKKGSRGAKRLVGLKIGASQLAAARVSNNGVAELEQVARQALPMGIVVGGELREPDALSDALKDFFARNKLPKKGVRLGIANNRIGVRIFDIVGVEEEKQLANAIHFRAQEALPIPLDEAVLDYHVLDETVDEEGRNVKRVLLVVAYKELIDRYVGACRKAGITLAGIDLEAFALLRSLSPPTDGGTAALVAVAIGYDRSTFAVSDGRVCEFTRVLEWGGWSLNVALARTFDAAPSEVEALKCALSLDGSAAPDDLTPEQTAAAVETVRRQVQSFARELVSSLQFYQNQPGSLGIGEIVITGGTAQLPGLAEELERLIGVKVRVGNPLARLKVAKRVGSPAAIGSLAVAIGLGIED